ncbi:MAG: N-acetylglucosaminyldiphospho-UDP N-acetyl-beta-D-mannosaminyltransferase, partial [Gammaproteobacteria bacterium]
MAIDIFRRTIPISNRQVWNVLGLPFDAVTVLDATQLIEAAVADEKALFLSTPNLNFAISAQSDATFFRSLIDSDLCVVDGMWLVWVAKLLGIPLNERVAGATLFED